MRYIVVNASQKAYPVETPEETEAAIKALIDCGEISARVYDGDPEDHDTRWTGQTLRVPFDKNRASFKAASMKPPVMINENNEARIERHPFQWIGYCDRLAESKASERSENADHRLYVSALKPHLFAVERLADGLVRYKVRGQWFSTLRAARQIA